MTSIETEIEIALAAADEPLAVNELSQRIDYSPDYTRKKAKELHFDDARPVTGSKTTIAPGWIIDDNYEVSTGHPDQLRELMHTYGSPPDDLDEMSVDEMRAWVKQNLVDRVVGGPKRWVFRHTGDT